MWKLLLLPREELLDFLEAFEGVFWAGEAGAGFEEFLSWLPRIDIDSYLRPFRLRVMKLYVPSENYTSQYPEWGAWQAEHFKALSVDSGLKQEGALLFVEGKVQELKALEDKSGFTAGVVDGKTYGVTVWFSDKNQGSIPQFDCGCPKGRGNSPCLHALALMATLVYLFHEYNFISLSPLLENVNTLARQIDRSPKKVRKKSLKRLRLRNLSSGPAYLEGDSQLPDALVQAINPYRELSRMARNTLELPNYQTVERVRALLYYVQETKIRLEAERPGGSFIELKPTLEHIGSRLRFIAVPEKNLVYFEPIIDQSEEDAVVAQFGEQIQILEPNRIAQIDQDKFQAVPIALARMEKGFTSFNRRGDCLTLETLNDYICRLPDLERGLLRQCDFTLRNGESCTVGFVGETAPVKMSVTLVIDAPEFQIGSHSATLSGDAAGEFVDLNPIFGDFMRRICAHAEESNRLLGNGARIELLLDAASQLPRIKRQADRQSFIRSVVARHEFNKEAQVEAATAFLLELERDYCRPRRALAPLFFEDSSKRTQCWQNTRLPLPGLLAITALLYRHGFFQRLIGMELHALPVNLTGYALQEIASSCEAFDIHLKVDDSRIVSRHASIQVDVFNDQKEDWFELKPSIQCEGITIGVDQWEALLHGQLLLEDKEGQSIAPKLDRPELLAHLIEATRSRGAGKGTARIHRLLLLDWIELRKQGLELRLPPEIDSLLLSLQDFEGVPRQEPPEALQAEMRPYQQRGFEWLVFLHQHRLGACLADDMGLGKTLQAIAFLLHLRSLTPADKPLRALAILPPSLIFNWENEVARFAPDLKLETYAGHHRDPAVFEQADLCLSTYDILRRDIKAFPDKPFSVVIFDEAQALKNHRSRRAAAARQLMSRFTLCLTGTPLENHVGEYHSIMDMALPGLMGERKAFLDSVKDGDEAPLRRARPFILRRSKSAILSELPPKVETDIALVMSDTQREIYTQIVSEVRQEVKVAYAEQSRAQAGIVALAALTRLRQLCVSPALLGHDKESPSPKVEYLVETLGELYEEGHAVLVFSQFVKALDVIERALKKEGHCLLRLDGSTPTAKRKRAVEKFQNSEQPEIFLISLKAGGVGLNLTRASYVIHVDPWWNPSVENQASDRAHRIGQKQTVFIQRLLMRDSVEEKIMALKARKKQLFDAIIGAGEASQQGSPSLQREDFDFLFGD